MNLFVRSQDKQILGKVDNLEIKYVTVEVPNSHYAYLSKYKIISQGTIFGEYDTEQRCLEILDEIQNEIQTASRDYIIWQSNSIFALSESDILEMNNQLQKSGIINVPKEVNAEFVPKGSQVVIYQMPEK